MDPDTALAELRAAIERRLAAAQSDSNDDEIDAGFDVAESAAALDEWLSKGGFPPAAWGAAHEPGWAREERLAEALCVEALTRAGEIDDAKARGVWRACMADGDEHIAHPLVAHFTHLADRVLATLQGEDETAAELHREEMRQDARS